MVTALFINGVTSYFTRRKPTGSEYEDGDHPTIDFSEEAPDWDLSDKDYARRKEATMDFKCAIVNDKNIEK